MAREGKAHTDVCFGRSLRVRIAGALIAASLLATAAPGPAFADVLGTGIEPSGTLEQAVPALPPAGRQVLQLPGAGDVGGIVNQVTGQVPGVGGLLPGGGSTPPGSSGAGPRQDTATQKPASADRREERYRRLRPAGPRPRPRRRRERAGSGAAAAGPASRGRRGRPEHPPRPLHRRKRSRQERPQERLAESPDGGPRLGRSWRRL